MPTFAAPDNTRLAYRSIGEGDPLVCVPGGPGQASEYLGDLGGLAARAGRELILLDTRGAGASEVPADSATYRCDAMVGDVESLREHLGLETFDLLGHSAGASLAVLYAAAQPERLRRLVLVTPSARPYGVPLTESDWEESMRRRSGEPWYADARAAMESEEESPELDAAQAPFFYGRYDGPAQQHAAAGAAQRNPDAARGFNAEGAFDADRLRASLRSLQAPTLLLVGGVDLMPTVAVAQQMASAFPDGRVKVQEGAGHFPWLDDPEAFTTAVSEFLG